MAFSVYCCCDSVDISRTPAKKMSSIGQIHKHFQIHNCTTFFTKSKDRKERLKVNNVIKRRETQIDYCLDNIF